MALNMIELSKHPDSIGRLAHSVQGEVLQWDTYMRALFFSAISHIISGEAFKRISRTNSADIPRLRPSDPGEACFTTSLWRPRLLETVWKAVHLSSTDDKCVG